MTSANVDIDCVCLEHMYGITQAVCVSERVDISKALTCVLVVGALGFPRQRSERANAAEAALVGCKDVNGPLFMECCKNCADE